MAREKLQSLLKELEAELENLPTLDDNARQELAALGDTITSRLDATDAAGESLSDRVAEAVNNFGGEHPTMTPILNRIASILSSLGI